MRTLAIRLILVTVVNPTWGLPLLQPGLPPEASLVHQARVIEQDDRKALTQLAREKRLPRALVARLRKVTGFIKCQDDRGAVFAASAMVLGSGRTVFTANHVLFDRKTRVRFDLNKCHYETQEKAPRIFEFEVNERTFVAGYSQFDGHQSNDWAIFRLKSSIGEDYIRVERDGFKTAKEVLNLAAYHRDTMARIPTTEPTAQACKVEQWFAGVGGLSTPLLALDCDSGPGSSGSVVLVLRDHEIYAIGALLGDGGGTDGAPYAVNTATYAIGIDDSILAQLDRIAGEVDQAQWRPSVSK